MDLWVGTSGYGYKEWKGSFYPGDLPAAKMLRYFGERLPAVEIDNTFYRLPRRSVLEAWAQEVPDRFRFTLKASRRITHFKRLKGAQDETDYLLATAACLGEKLGAILFQLPPNLPKDRERLESFLDHLATRATPAPPVAFEFRHASWFEPDVLDLLSSHGVSLCFVDGGEEGLEIPFTATSTWGYLRLRRPDYDERDLEAWCERIATQAWNQAFVFFKHEEAGAGPALAARLLESWRGSAAPELRGSSRIRS
ncbi:MAG: DUF72 domain-containing protein [Candidatus Eisenbacteria bacterium]|nr:DUF72 domain-containing protein [Candidatus Eisenbacteria bacterium]